MEKLALVKMMYEKHRKMQLNMQELCDELGDGYSYSTVSKMFLHDAGRTDAVIVSHKLIPRWKQNGKRKTWALSDIAEWLINNESNSK